LFVAMPGFKYVFIPCDATEPMQELDYDTDIKTLEDDNFRAYIEKYYAAQGQSVDRAVLLKQLQDRTGVDLEDKTRTGDMKEEALSRLLSSTSVEIFPVQLPTKASGFFSVSVYLDDKGVAKELEENSRVSGIVQQCGYPGQTFRGDCFMGRVFDDNEEEWYRLSFELKDCSCDAAWVKATKDQRSNRSVNDMSSMANKMGMNNPTHINPAVMPDQEAAKGETEVYRWKQADDEVEITFKKDDISKADKSKVKVVFGRQKLKVEFKGEVLLEGTLSGTTHVDESTWTLSDGVLQVNLSKASEGSWSKLLKDSGGYA